MKCFLIGTSARVDSLRFSFIDRVNPSSGIPTFDEKRNAAKGPFSHISRLLTFIEAEEGEQSRAKGLFTSRSRVAYFNSRNNTKWVGKMFHDDGELKIYMACRRTRSPKSIFCPPKFRRNEKTLKLVCTSTLLPKRKMCHWVDVVRASRSLKVARPAELPVSPFPPRW
jgi:hypothetical protein